MVTCMFSINKIHSSVLFDSCINRIFIDHKFRNMLNHKSNNDQVEGMLEILTNCLLTLNNHVFHVNIISMTIGSFYVIIRMEWLSPHRAEVLCSEKVIRLPLRNNEALVIYKNKLKENLRVTCCLKARKC